MSISTDGYVAGPGQCREHPLGVGGESLHDWHLGDTKDHPVNRQVISEMLDGRGATIMGCNMFGPVRGPWDDSDWRGWWGRYTAVSLSGLCAHTPRARPDRTAGRDDVSFRHRRDRGRVRPSRGGGGWPLDLDRGGSLVRPAGDRGRPCRRDRS